MFDLKETKTVYIFRLLLLYSLLHVALLNQTIFKRVDKKNKTYSFILRH